ncbi:MAG: replicative DNA helicase [Thermoanaerobaculia bacterium]
MKVPVYASPEKLLEVIASTPIHADEAERQTLNAVMTFEKGLYHVVKTGLRPEHFRDQRNALIFRTLLNLPPHLTVDILALRNELSRNGNLDAAGGLSYITSLTTTTPNAAAIELYCQMVREAYSKRQILRELARAVQSLETASVRTLIARLTGTLGDLVARDSDDSAPVPVGEVVDALVREIEYRRENEDFLTGIATGIPSLDAYLLGYQRGAVTIFGGYTSVGKTGLGLDLARRVVSVPGNERIHAAYNALEMTNRMLGFRLLSNASQEKLYRVRTGTVNDAGMSRVYEGQKLLQSISPRLHLCDGAFDILQIRSIARQLHHSGKLDVLFVDYLQLVDDAAGYSGNREQEVNRIGKSLVRLAKELDIAVVAFAQLNDGVANREGHEPKIQDMRESRAINQHARTVIAINRPWIFDRSNPDHSPCGTQLHILKNSESKLGVVDLHFNAAYATFEDGPCHPGCEHYRGDATLERAVGW